MESKQSLFYILYKIKKKINFYKYKIREIKQCIVNLLSTHFFFLISYSFYEFHVPILITG